MLYHNLLERGILTDLDTTPKDLRGKTYDKTSMKAIIVVIIFLFLLLIPAVESQEQAQEKSCTDLLAEAVKQIKGSEPQQAQETTPHGQKDGVKTDSTFIYCAYGVEGKGGETFPKSDGTYQLMIDEKDVDKNLGFVKLVVYHELEHVRLMMDGFGYKDPVTGGIVGPVYTNGKVDVGKQKWKDDILPCHEAIAHAKTVIYAQSIAGEFSNITNSKLFWHSIDLFEGYADKCKKASFKGKWEDVGKKIKDELEKMRDEIVEKKLLKAKKDGKPSKKDLKQINAIKEWLGMSKEEFEEIYRRVMVTMLEKKLETFIASAAIPSEIANLVQNERISLIIESENIAQRTLITRGTEIKDNRLFLKEQPEPTLTIRIDEAVFSSISDSLDPVYAVQTALKDGEIKIEKGPLTLFINFGQKILSKAPVPKETVEYGGKETVVKTNAKGVKFLEIGEGKEVLMLNKYLSPAGYSTSGAQRLLSYNSAELSKNAGIYAENLEQLRFGEI